jgi:hypothetical protein
MITLNANSLSERKGDLRSRKIARFGLVISLSFSLNTGLLKDSSVALQDNHIMNLKLFAYQSFKTYDQFDCYNYLVIKESRWNYKARNGSHYGLGQIRNKMVLKQTPKEQILFHMKYIGHRYGLVNGEPNACRAAEHFDTKGWH